MTKLLVKLCAASATIALLSGQHVFAQTQTTEPAEAEDATQDRRLDAVIVQARRVAESQQEVPLAVSTVGDLRLEQGTVTSVQDIEKLVPSLRVSEGATAQYDFTIRGSFLGFGVDPSVLSYLDEVPTTSKQLKYNIYDVSSVEVVKGPQGTLFGKNSTGGAVLFTSKRPDPSAFGASLRTQLGNYDQRLFDAVVNVPVSDNLSFRIAGKTERRDGFLESVTAPGLDYDNRKNDAAKLSVLWTPTDSIENLTILGHYRVDENRAYQRSETLVSGCTGPTSPVLSCLFQPPFNAILGTDDLLGWHLQERAFKDAGLNKTVNNYPNKDIIESDYIQNNFTMDFGNFGIKNILYYADRYELLDKDWDGTPASVVQADRAEWNDAFYTETQIYGDLLAERLDWRVGFVYGRDDVHTDGTQTVFPMPVSLTTPRRTITDNVYKTTAVFGTVSYDLSQLLDGLTATAGYRYTWDDRSVDFRAFAGQPVQNCALQTLPVPASGPVFQPDVDPATCTRSRTLKFEDDNYNLTLDWKVTDSVLLYAATRRGYKSGSFNISVVDPAIASYEPEIVEDIEIGIKADWTLGSMPVRSNIAVFDADYTDIQTSFTVVDTVLGTVAPVTLNRDPVTGLSSKASIKGFEIEILAKPLDWLELAGFYSKVKGEYSQFTNITSNTDLGGEDVAGITPESFGFTANADFPIQGPYDGIQATAGYFWRDASTTNSQTTLTTVPPAAYEQFDARIVFSNLFDSGADFAVFGRNLSDEVSCTTNILIPGQVTADCSEGRTYGIELKYSFGSERR